MRGRSGSCATLSAYGLSVHPPQSGARQLSAGRDAGGALFPSRSSSPSPVPRLAAPGQQLHSRGQVTALLWTVSLTLLRTKGPVAFRCGPKAGPPLVVDCRADSAVLT